MQIISFNALPLPSLKPHPIGLAEALILAIRLDPLRHLKGEPQQLLLLSESALSLNQDNSFISYFPLCVES